MADYTTAELLNEVSKVFRASLNPGKDGGTLNTATEYRQLLEMASITFLSNPDAVFYLARLAANKLSTIIAGEVAILEDILVALDDLGQIGSPVTDTTTLSNARTTVLALDAAQSVSNRPETQKFMRQMDTFATKLRKNLVSIERNGAFVRPREEARNLIQSNLQLLDETHAQLLDLLFSLKGALTDYLAMDIPSMVSSSVLSSVSSRLQSSVESLSTMSDTDNLAANRKLFLETLANKISIKVLATFTNPSDYKYRSPPRPIPSTVKHYGQVVGEGEPGSVLTSVGPWTLPISAPLVLSVSGGAPISIGLNSIKGAVLTARNSGPYEITADNQHLHVVVDPDIYEGIVQWSGVDWVSLSQYMPLGFKHLGALVSLPESDTGIDPKDVHTRFIIDLMALQHALAANVSWSSPNLTVTAFIADNEGAIGFQPGHVGAYVKDTSGNRFEIVRVVSTSQCVLDTRGITPNFSSGMELIGSPSSGTGSSAFAFRPAVTTAPVLGDRVVIGPSVKTATFTVGSRTASSLLSDFYTVPGLNEGADFGAKLYLHVNPELAPGDATRLCLRIRSKQNPYIQITGRFPRPRDPVNPLIIDTASAHKVLGYLEGESDTTNLLSPSELIDLINAQVGVVAELVTANISSGTLETTPLSSQVSAPGIDLGLTGGEQVVFESGAYAGTYRVVGIATNTLLLEGVTFISKELVPYRIFSEKVKISTSSAGPGSYLEVVSAPTELGLTVGKFYSSIPTFEAVDKLGNKLSFTGVVPGDLLRLVGQSEVEITEVQDTTLTLATGLPSNTSKAGFEIRSAAAKAYGELNDSLEEYCTSPNLLKKNKFDESVEAIDNACTSAVLPGQNFVASRNQAKRMVVDLLSILSKDFLRTDEYTTTVPTNPNNLNDLLAPYSVPSIVAVDSYLDALLDRKYDRAADLLQRCKFSEFYGSTDETGSFGGAVMSASRKVVKDLPRESRTRYDFLRRRDLATASTTLTDAEEDFSDTENEPEDYGL